MTDGCPACGGPLSPLGRLGRREWLRCRACGLEVSVEACEHPDSEDGWCLVCGEWTGPEDVLDTRETIGVRTSGTDQRGAACSQ